MQKGSSFSEQARAEAELQDKEADRRDALYRELIREEEVRPLIFGVVVCHIREAHRMLVLDDEVDDEAVGLGSELFAPPSLQGAKLLTCSFYLMMTQTFQMV